MENSKFDRRDEPRNLSFFDYRLTLWQSLKRLALLVMVGLVFAVALSFWFQYETFSQDPRVVFRRCFHFEMPDSVSEAYGHWISWQGGNGILRFQADMDVFELLIETERRNGGTSWNRQAIPPALESIPSLEPMFDTLSFFEAYPEIQKWWDPATVKSGTLVWYRSQAGTERVLIYDSDRHVVYFCMHWT